MKMFSKRVTKTTYLDEDGFDKEEGNPPNKMKIPTPSFFIYNPLNSIHIQEEASTITTC
jgi:hypothetical protein